MNFLNFVDTEFTLYHNLQSTFITIFFKSDIAYDNLSYVEMLLKQKVSVFDSSGYNFLETSPPAGVRELLKHHVDQLDI